MSKANYRSKSANLDQNALYISVVVPFHNAAKYIERCVMALISQTYPSSAYEIIMVDNNSTDNSADFVRKHPQIKLLSETKKGSYAARNQGVAESRGEIIAFTDSDCEPASKWLDKISEALHTPGAGLIQGGRLYTTKSRGMLLLEAYESERAFYTFSGKADGLYYGYTNNMAVRRDIFDRCGPFLEVMRGADSIFVNRVIDCYSPDIIRYVPDAVIRHLEITGAQDYLRKRASYGRSLQQNYSLRKSTNRKMTITERAKIIRATIERKRYNFSVSMYLILLVMLGMICFMSGRFSVKLEKLSQILAGPIWKRRER
jgi:glycosyltransferase involved in cell wall biosynthesis